MSDTGELRIEKVTPGNVTAACRLSVRPDQQEFVAPAAWSLAEAYASPGVAWQFHGEIVGALALDAP